MLKYILKRRVICKQILQCDMFVCSVVTKSVTLSLETEEMGMEVLVVFNADPFYLSNIIHL